jgi:AcrR family transcriptional regulator
VKPRRAPIRRVTRTVAKRPRIRLETDERRAQLLGLAKRAFSDRSYDDVSIDDLAREAKISKGLLYHYFPTKRDLYVAGLTEIADELVAAITGVPADLAPIERVRLSLDAYLEYISRQARGFISLMRGGIGSDPEVSGVLERVRASIVDEFLSGAPISAVLRQRPLSRIAIRGWIGMVEAVSIEWLGEKGLDRSIVRDLLVDTLFGLLLRVLDPNDAARYKASK